jgi:hypothetical protein
MARFITSVVFGTLVMLGLSYVWHGMVLNDFNSLSISKSLFFPLLGVVYGGIALLMTVLFSFITFEVNVTRNRILIGGALGFFIYLVAFVLGMSFSPPSEMDHLALDFVWQMMEQAAGALIIDFIFHIYHRREVLRSFEN